MKRSVIGLGCALLAGPAFAQSAGETTGVNSALGISPSTADFVKEVAVSDIFEIEAGKVAHAKGNALEKAFALQMVSRSHQDQQRAEGARLQRQGQGRAADGARQLAPEQARQAQGRTRQGLQLGFRFDAGEHARGCRVAVRTVRQRRRQSGPQGLGRQDPARPDTSSRNGAGTRQEEMIAGVRPAKAGKESPAPAGVFVWHFQHLPRCSLPLRVILYPTTCRNVPVAMRQNPPQGAWNGRPANPFPRRATEADQR
jgi:putative membrane protein